MTQPRLTSPAMIALGPLRREDAPACAHIRVAPEQEIFSGTVAEAFVEDPARFDLHGISENGVTIGLFKIDRAYHLAMPWAGPMAIGLRAFMIDHARQGRGVARAAMQRLGPYLRQQYPDAQIVKLTVDACNLAAIRCYATGGFIDSGRRIEGGPAGPQRMMWMDLRSA
ncbi:GNAT family N-acetyltransferase [Gymnodinialimonas sp. 2305UL16-5]|uniref:GNAT family N-acetyltransferase n=1 Tax=Gymnodinialimonas mytili TaxID=3126503 RepID=UPI003098D02B